MNYNTIVKLAKNVKAYVEKHNKFPTSTTIDGVKYNYGQYAYYFANFIVNSGRKVADKQVKNPSNPTGDHIEEKVTASDFKDQAKRIVQFIKQNGKAPNYVTTVKSKKKIRPRDYIYAFAKIVVFYSTHTRMPNTCEYTSKIYKSSSKPSKKKKGHSTVHGCDNMGQNTSYYCGDHSLQEIFRNLTGKVVKQSTLAKVCGTTTSGTDHQGLLTGIAWFNKTYHTNLNAKWVNFSELGWKGIQKIIESDNQDCLIHNLYRRKWGHYEVVNSLSKNNIKVQNSLGDHCGSCYCGYVENRSPAEYLSYINGISQKSVLVVTRK